MVGERVRVVGGESEGGRGKGGEERGEGRDGGEEVGRDGGVQKEGGREIYAKRIVKGILVTPFSALPSV